MPYLPLRRSLLMLPRHAGHIITITLHSSHAFSCKHPFYVLSASSQEVQMAWVNAMWQVGGEVQDKQNLGLCTTMASAVGRNARHGASSFDP